METAFISGEVIKACLDMENGKAVGTDDFQAKFMKYVNEKVQSVIADTYKTTTKTGDLPTPKRNTGLLLPQQNPKLKKTDKPQANHAAIYLAQNRYYKIAETDWEPEAGDLKVNHSATELNEIPTPLPPETFEVLLANKNDKTYWSALDWLVNYNPETPPGKTLHWRKCKLLGSYLDPVMDISNRKSLSLQIMNKFTEIFNPKWVSMLLFREHKYTKS